MLKIAHRSGPDIHPEQTLAAALHAASIGADMVEVDVRLTGDEKLAVSHDLNLSRIFGIDRDVDTVTADEFLVLHHKSNPEYRAHLIEEYLEAVPVPLLIHIKEIRSPELTARVIQRLLETIDRFSCAERVVLGVPTVAAAEQIRQHDPRIRILSFCGQNSIPDFIKFGADYIRLWENWLEPALVRSVRDAGIPIWVMSGILAEGTTGVPSDAGLQNTLSFNPDGILINHISRLNK